MIYLYFGVRYETHPRAAWLGNYLNLKLDIYYCDHGQYSA